MNRRRFLNFVLGGGLLGWLASVLYPVFSFLNPPKKLEANVNSIKVGAVADFPPNSGKIVKFGRKPVILIRMENGKFRAFSATCTHLECIVQYRSDLQEIWCACHNGLYDLNGRNISGPPPKPLEPYVVNIVNNEISISRPS